MFWYYYAFVSYQFILKALILVLHKFYTNILIAERMSWKLSTERESMANAKILSTFVFLKQWSWFEMPLKSSFLKQVSYI